MKLAEGLKIETTSREGVSLMVDLVSGEYPEHERNTYAKMISLISDEFGVQVTIDDLVKLGTLDREIEDRTLTYKHAMGY